jgi:hypothetical protein
MWSTSKFSEANATSKEKIEELEILILELIKAYWLGTQAKGKHTNVSM